MLMLQDEHAWHMADYEIRLLQAIRAAVPASLDKNAGDDYADRLQDLNEILTDETDV